MFKGNDKLRPLGICQRFISFLVNNLTGHGHEKVTLGAAVPPDESIEVPISGSSRNIRIMPSNTNIGNGALNNEVIIDFRHIEEPEISVQKLSSQVDFPKRYGFISRADEALTQQQGKERQKHSDARGFGKGHQEENLNASKRKEEDIPTETTSGNESEEAKTKHLARASRPPLIRVASNINEKADAFIRSRKETMSKNYSFEQPRKL